MVVLERILVEFEYIIDENDWLADEIRSAFAYIKHTSFDDRQFQYCAE